MHDFLLSEFSSSDEATLEKSSIGNIPDDAMSLSSLSSNNERIVENDPNKIIPQYLPLPNYPQEYYCPSQFNNYGYQHNYIYPSYPFYPNLPSTRFHGESELQHDKHGDENLPAKLKKYE